MPSTRSRATTTIFRPFCRQRATLLGLVLLMSIAAMQMANAGGHGYKLRVLKHHPLAYWRFNETSGSVAHDITGRYDGTYTHSPDVGVLGLLAAPSGHSVWLDGSDQRVTADSVTQWTNWPGYTLEAWVRITQDTEEEHILAFNDYAGGNGLALFHDQPTGRFKFRDCEGSGCTHVLSTTMPEVGKTYYLAVTVDGQNGGEFYVNGQEEATFNSDKRPLHDGLFTIGAEYDNGSSGAIPTSFFRGKIDEVAIYDHALGDGVISAHYKAGLYIHGSGHQG